MRDLVPDTFVRLTGGATLVKSLNLLCHHLENGDDTGTYFMESGLRIQCIKAHI